MARRLLTRVALRNYKSIAACDVAPAQLSFLVGRNGSGKSNFLDALRFVADSLRFSMDHALRDRGGINEVRRRSGGHPTNFTIRLDIALADGHGHYAFTVGAKKQSGYEIQKEECRVVPDWGTGAHYYRTERGQVTEATFSPRPAASPDRLYLVAMSGTDAFRPIYDALSGTEVYNPNPEALRNPQPPDPGDLLARDGSNIASTLARLERQSPALKQRIEAYLGQAVPGISGIGRRLIGTHETLEFRQEVRGAQHPWRFFASNMSDGTLRMLGVLVALFQGAGSDAANPHIVGLEEPETALHPAAFGILLDSLRDATDHAQILVTSHSPDLLDDDGIGEDSILAVQAMHGETRTGPLSAVGRRVLRDHLYTPGELLRMDQIEPDPIRSTLKPGQLRLFGSEI